MATTTTTIRVSTELHEQLRALAAESDTTITDVLRRMLRRERQRLMGIQDAERGLNGEERAIVAAAGRNVATVLAEDERAGR